MQAPGSFHSLDARPAVSVWLKYLVTWDEARRQF